MALQMNYTLALYGHLPSAGNERVNNITQTNKHNIQKKPRFLSETSSEWLRFTGRTLVGDLFFILKPLFQP